MSYLLAWHPCSQPQPCECVPLLGSNTPLDITQHVSRHWQCCRAFDVLPFGLEGFSDAKMCLHLTPHCFATHLITPPQAPAGAPPDVWSQLLSCCEACANQQYMDYGALLAEVLQQQMQAALQQQQHENGSEDGQHEEAEEEPLAGPG